MSVSKGLYSVSEAQAFLGLSRSKIYELLKTADLPSVKIGRRRLIPVAGLEAWVDSLDKATSQITGTEV